MVPMSLAEHDPVRLEDGIKHPQPLCREPLRSVWSPESPSPIEELDEMGLDPSTPSSSRSSTISSLWSLESLPHDQQDSELDDQSSSSRQQPLAFRPRPSIFLAPCL